MTAEVPFVRELEEAELLEVARTIMTDMEKKFDIDKLENEVNEVLEHRAKITMALNNYRYTKEKELQRQKYEAMNMFERFKAARKIAKSITKTPEQWEQHQGSLLVSEDLIIRTGRLFRVTIEPSGIGFGFFGSWVIRRALRKYVGYVARDV